MPDDLPTLGWKEQVSFPEWGIRRLRAKLDTGARTSALHVEDYRVVGHHSSRGERLPVLRFHVLVGPRTRPRRVEITTPVLDFRVVRDSGAESEERPVVRTRLVIGPVDCVTEITITDRSGMNFRMLVGRSTVAGRCLIDPGHGYLHTPTPPRHPHPDRDG